MYGVTLQIPTDVLDAIEDTARRAPKMMNLIVKRRFTRTKQQMLHELTAEPDELTSDDYPLDWQSERQRRFVMATLRQRNNLPYRRTHSLVNDWEITLALSPIGGKFTVENDNPAVDYVQGDSTQRMHLQHGWPQAAPIISKYEDLLVDQLIEDWYTVTDPFAGVPQV